MPLGGILLFFVALALFSRCTQDDSIDFLSNDNIMVNDSVSMRAGNLTGVWYVASNSFAAPSENIQLAFNKDSIININFKRTPGKLTDVYTKVLGTLDPNYQNKPARKYDITVTTVNSTYHYPKTWIHDTTAISFNTIGKINLIPGNHITYKTFRSTDQMFYYDTNYKVYKLKYLYSVELDQTSYKDFIPSSNSGTVHWISHTMK